ncbi:type I secretion C-terminal target domain-containing protein [Pseudomonas frederiksbergensis]|uniref:VCBS domain-containing protein n=1 Tax=Pseudomonas frederiksbergensis TaxID=104087 RepID=UPI0019812BA8|nr:VCBS domain-containing protein [Pseudomonas frederiksbergensis]MBN3861189.1 type I secretion C-terminal target domain-containing protein [Pseudomonas frederiksbergensis]
MATTTTTSGGTVTSFSNTPQATGDIFTTGVTDAGAASITEELLGVVYLDVMSNDLGGNAKTLWSLDNATSLSTATKVYAPADLLVQDTCRIEATSTDTSFNGAKIWITSDGKVGYDAATLSTAFKAQLQALAAGASLTDSFTYAIRLGNGTLSWATAQVQFAGMNDSVTMSIGMQAGTVTEDAATTPSPTDSLSSTDSLSATGTIAFSDVDLSDTHTASFVAAGGNATALGTFVLAPVTEAANAADGTVSWTYTIDNAAAQSLAQGQTASETYVVTISDGHGSLTTQNVFITITGTNDQVQITSGVQAGDAKEDSGDYAASGSITFTDVDLIDTHSVTVTPGASGYLGSFTTDPLNDSTGTDSGSLGWHFAVDNAALQFLGEGETRTQTYNVAIGDGVVQTVTITITGTNDRPTLTIADSAGAMNEGNGAATLSDSGVLSFVDPDSIDTVTVSHTSNGDIAWSGGMLNAGVASALVAGFSVDQDSWNYSSNQNLDFLGAGETITFSYTVVATDDSGAADAASAPQTVTITITGSNDAPVLSFATGNDIGTVKEDTELSVSGQFSSADIDHDATASWTINGSPTGTYGSIAVDSTGQWTYTLANGTDGVASAVQSLKAGESHNEVFSVQVSDGLGGVDTQQVTVTVTGSNDAPVLSFATGNDIGTVKEDTKLSVSGQFSSADIDHDATASWTINGSPTGTYGSIAVDSTGQWTYTLANGTDGVASAVQSLKAGESHNEVFSVQVSDGLGGVDTQQVTVTVTGSNDAPVLSFATGNDVGTVKEDTKLSVSGQFSSADIDHDATASWTINGSPTGTYGSIAVDSTGQWTYTLANGTDGVASAVQSLKAGESYNEVFSVQVSDGLGGVDTQQVTVTVTGSNDAAVLSSASVTLSETNAPLTSGGSLTVSDIDSPESFQAQSNTAGSYGKFSIGTDGAWAYVADSAHNEFAAGTTYTDTFAVSSADGTLTSVTVHILGTNDAAVLSADIANLTETNTAADISTAGTLTISDVDSTATFVAQTNTAGSYGKFSIGTDGAWTYIADSAHNEFAAGITYTDTFAVSSADGTLTSVTVHILGTNDAAVLSADIANLTETNTAADISTAGTLTISDVDSTATFVAQTNTAGSYGKFSIGTDGAWTYIADSAHNEFAAGITYTDTFAVSSADGTLTSVTVQIAGSNDSPTITSNGGGATASINVAENITAVTTVAATDADLPAQTLSYSIVGGADAAKFSIVSGTGVLSFISAPNFEAPTDSGTNNVYDVIVRASDGTLFDDQAIAVTVTGVNDNSPIITSNGGGAAASVSVAENTTVVTTVVATDADLPAQTLSYSIVGGADAAKFSITSGTGALSFVSAPNFEAPTDSGTNNVYNVIVRASDGTLFDDQAIAVTVTNVNDNPVVGPTDSNAAANSVAENAAVGTAVGITALATDADAGGQTITYSLADNAGGRFAINSNTGVVSTAGALSYETATNHTITVQATSADGSTATQTFNIAISNVDEVAPTTTLTIGSGRNSASGVATDTDGSGVWKVEVFVGSTLVSTVTTFNAAGAWTFNFNGGNKPSNGATVTAKVYDNAGNFSITSTVAPAGIAGEPINLALTGPEDHLGGVAVNIRGLPAGWTISGGTDNGDGSWTVLTTDPGSLTVTTSADFVGALVLDVRMSWSNADGSMGNATVYDNIEAYAPGSPIFALSADDNLTGSSGADLFVFAQPIGNNVIHSFNAAADKIDLIGFTGVTGFADLSITNDANGNALVSIGSGQTVTLKGIDAADLSEANFQFDVDPLTNNAGTLTIADGAIMPFGGSIHNSGTIELGSTGSETSLEILFRGATLTGGGQVLLSDSAQNVIFGGTADTVLTNVDNRISGAGQLGAGQMVLVNAGLILASGLNSLVLDTGTHTIVNSGVLESTGAGGMTVASAVENSGHLWANGGDLRLLADVTGNGSATIDGDATLTFAGAAHGSVAFHGEGAGTLVIAQAESAGSLVGILGLESDDMLTFGDLAFGANTQLSYSANASGAGGLLTVEDGMHRAEMNLLGHYSVEAFQITDGGEAGTQVSYQGESSGTLVGSMLADTLSGGDGNDIIVGRGGEDTLSGGAGADVFAYLNVDEGGDTILDYNFAEGDALDLSALLSANFVSGISQASDFVQLAQSGSDITVKVDIDGAANGTNFADVAVLANTGTSGTDLVRTWFGEGDHTLTA